MERALVVAGLALLLAFPLAASALGGEFYVGLAARILIMALAATSLNLALGYGGMVSLGHSAFLGTGAYTVAILMAEGFDSGWLAIPAAVVLCALLGLAIGALSLRTKGPYFLMVTLAFAQMLYYAVVSLKRYNGDDGLNLPHRSHFGIGWDLAGDNAFFYFVLAVVIPCIYGIHRLVESRFGFALRALRDNPARAEAVGFPIFRIRLAAFTISAALTGLAGALLANQASFAGPGMLYWTQSGVLMVMVIMGGVGHRYGGLFGAAAYLILEEVASSYTQYWHFGLGACLLVLVLVLPGGISTLLARMRRRP
jgi:branched-chain amino acid transport system permease protein